MGLDTTSTFSKQLTQKGCHLRLFIKNFKESKNMSGFSSPNLPLFKIN